MNNKLLVIIGPTASGKTSLAVKLSKKVYGEIISADSRQIYKGMDIGTGKDVSPKDIEKKKKAGGKIWGLDLVEPNQKFSAGNWVSFAKEVIKNIQKRKKLPIIVGGTLFWIKTLIEGADSLGIAPDWELREKLNNLKTTDLKKILKEENLQRFKKMNQSDKNNPRRLIRAIEVARASEDVKSLKPIQGDFFIISLQASNDFIYNKIDKRVKKRLKQGVKQEIEELLTKGYNFKNSVLGSTLAYQEWDGFFKGDLTESEAVEKWKFAEHAYARRQKTFLKKFLKKIKIPKKNIYTVNIEKDFYKKLERKVKKWIDN